VLLAISDGTPPLLTLPVPVHGECQGIFKGVPGSVAQLRYFGAVQGVAAVVPRPVRNLLDKSFRLAQQPQDLVRDLTVGPLIAATYVVRLAGGALLPHRQNSKSMIQRENPVPALHAVTV